MKSIIIIILIVIAFFLIITALTTAALFRYGFVRMSEDEYKKRAGKGNAKLEAYFEKKRRGINWLAKYKCRELYTESIDRLRLYARYLPSDVPSEKTVILFHGYRACAEADFGELFEYYHSHNYNLIIPDQRSHGKSEGKYIAFGVLERFDCISWINKSISEFGENQQIVISGLSMGAATVLMSLDLELPPQVKGVIADCGFTSPYSILTHVMHTKFHMPSFPLIYTVGTTAKLFAKFGLKDASTLNSIKNSSLPLLLIHGESDNFVPVKMSVENYSSALNSSDGAKPRAELLIVDNAKHAESYTVDHVSYDKALDSFFEKIWR